MQADDMDLLQEFARNGSEEAFTALVRRHVNLVYSVAWRQLGNPHDAEEVAQAVFVILARKAAELRQGTILSGWLYQTARFTAANYRRAASRRRHREQEAFMQYAENSDPDVSWQRLSPLLEEAMARLGQNERDAVVLRFFENRTVREVAGALGLEEAAAQKRVNRATEKLRAFFARRGVQVSTVTLLASLGTHAVQAAPADLAVRLAAGAALKGAAASGSSLTLIKTTLKFMAWTKAKTAIVFGTVLILAGGTATMVMHHRTMAPAQPSPFTFAGYATPETSIQSYAWALGTGDLAKLNDCLFKQEDLKALSGDELNRNRQNMRILADALVGYTITQTDTVSDVEVHLHIHAQPPIGDSIQIMKKSGNEWKVVGEFHP
jgi:RNA polymerase sigma factor (sigma-70 family)